MVFVIGRSCAVVRCSPQFGQGFCDALIVRAPLCAVKLHILPVLIISRIYDVFVHSTGTCRYSIVNFLGCVSGVLSEVFVDN